MPGRSQDSRIFSATVNEFKEIGVSFDSNAAISHGCLLTQALFFCINTETINGILTLGNPNAENSIIQFVKTITV
jgi:hypothetical protein